MISKKYNKICWLVIILSILFVSYIGINNIFEYTNNWYETDPGEDEFALVGGIHFADHGFLSNAGLWYRCYKTDKLLSWQLSRKHLNTNCVTRAHYPSLPAWIAGALIKIIGEEKIYNGQLHYYRIFPLIIGIISVILFAYMMISSFDIVKATIIIVAVSTAGMTSNLIGHLGLEGYTTPLYILQLGMFLYIFKKGENFKSKYCMVLFLLGFLQGWLTYDLFFVVSFAGIPFALLYATPNKSESIKRFFYALIFPLAGFGLAHVLHLVQFAVYYDSIKAAFDDLLNSAQYRSQGGSDHVYGDINKFKMERGQGSDIGRITLLKHYINNWVDFPDYFVSFVRPFKKFIVIIFVMTLFQDVRMKIKKPFQVLLKWTSSYATTIAILTAFLISILWLVVMKQFSGVNELKPFVTRHFFLIYFICIVTVVDSFSLDNNDHLAKHKS